MKQKSTYSSKATQANFWPNSGAETQLKSMLLEQQTPETIEKFLYVHQKNLKISGFHLTLTSQDKHLAYKWQKIIDVAKAYNCNSQILSLLLNTLAKAYCKEGDYNSLLHVLKKNKKFFSTADLSQYCYALPGDYKIAYIKEIEQLLGETANTPDEKLALSRQTKKQDLPLAPLQTFYPKKKIDLFVGDIIQTTIEIEALGWSFLNATSVLQQLTGNLESFVTNYKVNDINKILTICTHVSNWQLYKAMLQFTPLFMGMSSDDLMKLTFCEWTRVISIFAKCKTLQQSFNTYLLPLFEKATFKIEEANPNALTDISQMLYALALFDCTQSSTCYYEIARGLFGLLIDWKATSQINDYNISQLFHSYYFFNLKYKLDDWWTNELFETHFKRYMGSLVKNTTISCSQYRIFQELQKLFPNIQQEVLIEEAGRSVDFLIGKLVIQYNGFWRHYYYHDDGTIAEPAAKDILTTETLKLAGYQVIIINQWDWDLIFNDAEQHSTFLRNLLANYLPCVSKTPQTFYGKSTSLEAEESKVSSPVLEKPFGT